MFVIASRIIMTMFTVLYTFVIVGSCAPLPPAPVDAVRIDIPAETPKVRTLTILQSRGEISHALQVAAERYLADHPDVQIHIQTIGGESSYRATLRSRLLAGEQVDLFHIFSYRDMQELEGRLEDLSGLGWAGEAADGVLEPVKQPDGAFYGVPYSIECVGLIANTEIFEAAEIHLSGDETFEELEEAFKALREKITLGELEEDFPELEAVTELPGQDYVFLGSQLADVALTGEFLSPAQASEASSIVFEKEAETGKYVDLLARYATNGRGWTGLVQIPDTAQVENGLASGRVAIIQQNIQVYERILRMNPEIGSKLQLLPIPLEGSGQGYIYTSAPAFWAVNSASSDESKEIAMDFLTWLYQSDTGAELIANSFSAVSPYRETAADTGVQLHNDMLRLIGQERSLPRYYREFPPGWGSGSFSEALRGYFSVSDYTWAEVAEKVKAEWVQRHVG